MYWKQAARMGLVILASPFIFMMIALITALRPMTACRDGFRGPERMWSAVLDWARGLPTGFGQWSKLMRAGIR